MLIDLERFQVINDTLGRSAADDLLKLVAARLQSVIFDRDSLARVHGDVFAVLFTDIKDEADIARIVEEKIIGCLISALHDRRAGTAGFREDRGGVVSR